MKRHDFVNWSLTGAVAPSMIGCQTASRPDNRPSDSSLNPIFPVRQIADDALIRLMGENGIKFYRCSLSGVYRDPEGQIAPDDVILLKVNSQWKYRGCCLCGLPPLRWPRRKMGLSRVPKDGRL